MKATDETAGALQRRSARHRLQRNYLLEILRYIPTDEVKLTFKAPERAATLEPEGGAEPGRICAGDAAAAGGLDARRQRREAGARTRKGVTSSGPGCNATPSATSCFLLP